MRKKVISVILFGALVLASTSTFVSCKDYNDEITNLQGQMNEEKVKSMTLQAQLEALVTTLQSELAEVRASYETQLAEAKSALQTEISQKADAATVSALADRIVTLETGFSATTSTLQSQIDACNSAIEAINTAIADRATVAELNAVKADAAANLAALSGDVGQLTEQLNTLSAETRESIATILSNIAALQSKDAELAGKDNEILAKIADDYQALLTAIAQAKQAAMDDASAMITNEEAARIAAINDLKTQIQTLQTFQTAIESADFQSQISGIETALNNFKSEIEGMDFQGQINAITQNIQTVEGSIAELTGKIAANEISISDLQTEMGTISNKLAAMEQAFQGQINSLTVLIEKSLTSLVFKPTQYIYGFGAINVMSFEDCMVLKHESVADATYGINGKLDEYVIPAANIQKSTWVPSVHARYHMNPSTADYTKYDFTFADVETQNILTRANDEKKIGATAGQVSAENGVLDVELNIGLHENLNDAVAQPEGFAWVSTLALEATEKNTNPAKKVTSDYALVVPNYYDNLCLANNQANPLDHNSGDNRSHHIRTSALATITDALVTFEVPYNGTLDLSQYIETHYGVSPTASGTKVGDKAFTAAEFAASGLKYNYALVSYKTATRSNQASIAEIDDAGVTKVKDQDAKYIGETYIARILLRDGNNKDLAVGYVKILVVDQGAEAATITTGIILNCDNPTNASIPMSTFVDQFKESYSSSLTINDFKGTSTKYSLDENVYADKGTNPTPFGKGKFLLSGNNLVLSLTSAEAKELFYKNDIVVPQTVKVYAKFAHQADGYSDLWVEYTIDKDRIIYAQGTFTDADKVKVYWYEQNSKNGASAGKYDEIHANVSVPETGSTPTFNFNVLNTFVGQKAHISGIHEALTNYTADPYADLTIANSDFNKRKVTGTSGVQYQLVVVDDKTLAAYKVGDAPSTAQNVVILSDTYFGTANYQENPYAKDILNYASHAELAEGETFAIEILLVQNRNCYNVELTGNTFQVKFLRPINTKDLEAPATIDAEHGAGFWYVQNLVEFSDWRDYKFEQYPQFYSFYGVVASSIVPAKLDANDSTLIEGCTTDINGNGNDLLAEVAPGIKLTWDANAANSIINGKIVYVNNGATINDTFHIYVPMAITYKWGTIYTKVTLTIAPTIHQIKPYRS